MKPAFAPIHAASPLELRAALAPHGTCRHPGFGRERKEYLECWMIAHVLDALADEPMLSYPVLLTKSESPDFTLATASGTIGTEIVEAVSPVMAHARALREKECPDALIFSQPFSASKAHPDKIRMHEIASGKNAGPPWMGDAPERGWGAAIASVIADKCEVAKKSEFRLWPRNWLAIADSLSEPIERDFEKAVAYLLQNLRDAESIAPFSSIYIVRDARLIEIRASHEYKILELNPPWLAALDTRQGPSE